MAALVARSLSHSDVHRTHRRYKVVHARMVEVCGPQGIDKVGGGEGGGGLLIRSLV